MDVNTCVLNAFIPQKEVMVLQVSDLLMISSVGGQFPYVMHQGKIAINRECDSLDSLIG